jgi:ribose 5-phosphate isomerase B
VVLDLGTNDTQSVDYPNFAYALTAAVRDGRVERGVLVCGSGIGISIAANRAPEIRAALIHDAFGARMARRHNDANVICFGGQTIGFDVARDCLRIFLETEFEGGRHALRIDKLNNPT